MLPICSHNKVSYNTLVLETSTTTRPTHFRTDGTRIPGAILLDLPYDVIDRSAFVFIFVEKSPPYAVAVYQPCDLVMQAGEMIINRDLRVLKDCYANGEWPGYPQTITACGLPQFQMKQLENLL